MTGTAQTETPKAETTEHIEIDGSRLVDKVKEIVAEGRVKRLRVLEPDGDIALDISLNVAVLAGGAMVLAAPVLAVLGALAVFFTKVKVEIVREADDSLAES